MVFSSMTFLCLFLPAVFLLHTAVKNIHLRNGVLLVSSLLFYAWGEPVWIIAMLIATAINYFCALYIHNEQNIALDNCKMKTPGKIRALCFTWYLNKNLLEQANNGAIVEKVYLLCCRDFRKTWHGHDISRKCNDESSPGRNLQAANGNGKSFRSSQQ